MSSALFPRLELKATLPYPPGDRMAGESWNATSTSVLENPIGFSIQPPYNPVSFCCFMQCLAVEKALYFLSECWAVDMAKSQETASVVKKAKVTISNSHL